MILVCRVSYVLYTCSGKISPDHSEFVRPLLTDVSRRAPSVVVTLRIAPTLKGGGGILGNRLRSFFGSGLKVQGSVDELQAATSTYSVRNDTVRYATLL